MIREPPPFGGLQLAKYTIHNQGHGLHDAQYPEVP